VEKSDAQLWNVFERKSLRSPIGWAFDQVKEVALRVGEEEDAAGAPRGFDGFIEGHAQARELVTGRFDVMDAQGEVAYPRDPVAGGAWVGFGGVDFQPEAAGKFEHESRRGLAELGQDTGAEDADVPVFQNDGVGGGEAEVFGLQGHNL